MNLTDAVETECLLERLERQRLVQVWTEVPGFDHSGENIHEQSEIDEALLETHIGNIGPPRPDPDERSQGLRASCSTVYPPEAILLFDTHA